MDYFFPADHKDSPAESTSSTARLHPLTRAVIVALTGAVLLSSCAGDPVREEPLAEADVSQAKAAYMREDYRTAAGMLEGPAMKGDAEAQYALGYMYYYGKGVLRDRNRARGWFEDSARLGNGDAQRALALLRAYGQLPPLPENAVKTDYSGGSAAGPASATGSSGTGSGARLSTARYKPQAAPVDELFAPEASGEAKSEASAAAVVDTAPAGEIQGAKAVADPGAGETGAPSAPTSDKPREEPAPTGRTDASLSASSSEPSYLQKTHAVSAAPKGEAIRASYNVEPSISMQDDTPVSSRYTLYLVSSRDKSDLVRIAKSNDLDHAASYYTMGRRYHMVYGDFETVSDAREVLRSLPESLNRYKPWVNDFPKAVKLTRLN